MAGNDITVPSTLRGPTQAPTIELQAAYNDLSSYLSLRSSDDLFGSTTAGQSPEQIAAQSKSTAISALLSPDGAFFTTDLFSRGVIAQLGLAAINDISIYGTTDFKAKSDNVDVSYSEGKTLKDKIGLTPGATDIDNQVFTAEIDSEIKSINDKIDSLTSQIGSLEKERSDLKKAAGPAGGIIGALASTSLTAQDNSIKQNIDALKAQIDDLKKQRESDIVRKGIRSATKSTVDIVYTEVNSTSTTPAAHKSPHVSLYRHVNRYLEPASIASDYCNVFFNSIDSINMSLCVPYFRMNIVDRFSKKKGRFSKLSLSAFLKQSPEIENDKIFYNAEPVLFSTPTQIAKKLKSGKVVSMETFFAPQTLLPDPTEVLSNPRRLDTSVPLLSLNSFSVSIESVGIALMSKKTADLSITLHDRSRLSDISPLVSTGNFSSLYFEIEWGWIHPHAGPEFNNPVARYLNALRFREVFAPTSYNMTMQDGGAMSINLRLIGGASLDAVNGSILNGGFITRTFATDMLNRLIKADIEETSGQQEATTEIRPITQLLIDESRTGHMIDRAFIDKMWEYSEKEETTPAERKTLFEELTKLLNDSDYFKNEEIFEQIKSILKKVSVTGFDSSFDKIVSKYRTVKEEYTSVAAYLTVLAAMPLAATGLYDEVQIHTFKFNDGAGDLKGTQIADAPVRILDVMKKSGSPGALSEKSNISTALMLLGDYLNNPKQPQYGIAELSDYLTIKNDEGQQPQGDPGSKPSDKTDKPPKDSSAYQTNLKTFTTPNIRFLIRSVPAKVFPDSPTSPADYQIDPSRLIAQILVFDANASPNFDKIIAAYEYGKTKGTNPAGQEIPTDGITSDVAKDTFKRLAPSIIYGATNSVLKSVSVSTDINSAIAQQQIIEFGKSSFLNNVKADESSDVNEVTLFPGSVTINMIGMPIIERGQEVFLDLGTGTTLDALYYVTSVKHDFRPGDFTTNLSLIYKGQGSISSLKTMIENYNKTLKKPDQAAPPTPTPTSSHPDQLTSYRDFQQLKNDSKI